MIILGINTVESLTSLSIVRDYKLLASINVNERKKTASMLIPYIDYILKQLEITIKDIDLISICSGPGSYTSLRIGFSTAKTLAIVNNIKFATVSRFRIMAEAFLEYNRKQINTNVLNIISVLPTTYNKILTQSFYYKKEEDILKEGSKARITDIASIFENYDGLNTVVVGEFRNHKKIEDFELILELDKYYEYKDRGHSSLIVAETGFELFKKGEETEPYKAEPLYISSPF